MSAAGDRLQDVARATALALPGTDHGYPFTERLDVDKVAGKVFLIVTDDPDDQITRPADPAGHSTCERDMA
ncbi:MAG: hypothetical protein ABIQ18_33400 [Umezawaea sp.]